MNKEMCLVPKEELRQLLADSRILAALDEGGVDNWIWYWDSMNNSFSSEMKHGFSKSEKENLIKAYSEESGCEEDLFGDNSVMLDAIVDKDLSQYSVLTVDSHNHYHLD